MKILQIKVWRVPPKTELIDSVNIKGERSTCYVTFDEDRWEGEALIYKVGLPELGTEITEDGRTYAIIEAETTFRDRKLHNVKLLSQTATFR